MIENTNDLEIRFIKEGGYYKLQEINKKMIINNGKIFLENKETFYDDDIPKINFNKGKISIRDAFEFCYKKHSNYNKKL